MLYANNVIFENGVTTYKFKISNNCEKQSEWKGG